MELMKELYYIHIEEFEKVEFVCIAVQFQVKINIIYYFCFKFLSCGYCKDHLWPIL